MNGVFIIDKPHGWTSHDVVNRVRRLFQQRRIGHAGTLDPMATGVLVLCAGKATKIVRYLESDDKEYTAEFRLGITTDTLDADGRIVGRTAYEPLSQNTLADVLRSFTGPILQRPPAYSAIKINGVPSYRLARSGRSQLHPERPVVIYRLSLLDYSDPFVRIKVHCSKGTYVRALCSDIGERLGMGGHLTGLVRDRSGKFGLDKAVSIERLAAQVAAGEEAYLSMSAALQDMPEVVVDDASANRISHGNPVPWHPADRPGNEGARFRILDGHAQLIGVGTISKGQLVPETVLT